MTTLFKIFADGLVLMFLAVCVVGIIGGIGHAETGNPHSYVYATIGLCVFVVLSGVVGYAVNNPGQIIRWVRQ